MTHPTWEESNLHFYEGLEPGRREEVATHVAGCPECAARLERLAGEARVVAGAIAGGAAPAPPARLARPARRVRVGWVAAAGLLAAGVLLAAGMALLPGNGGRGSRDGPLPTSDPRPPSPDFLARTVSGDGWTDASGSPIAAWTTFAPHETHSLAARARAELLLGDGTYLEALPGTEVAIGPIEEGRPRIRLAKGRVFLDVAKGPSTLAIETRAGEVRALGTRFEVAAPAGDAGRLEVTVWEGTVELRTAASRVLGHPGEILWSERDGASGKRIGLPGNRAWLFPVELRVPEISPAPLGPWRIEYAGDRVVFVAEFFGITPSGFVRANRTVVLASEDRGVSWKVLADLEGKAPMDSRAREGTLSLLAMDFQSGALSTIDVPLAGRVLARSTPLPPLSREATWARWAWNGERGLVVAGGPGKLLARELATSLDGGATWEPFVAFETPSPRDPEEEEVDWAVGARDGRFELWRFEKEMDHVAGYSSTDGGAWREEELAFPSEHSPARLRQVLAGPGGPLFLATGPRGHFLFEPDGPGGPLARTVPGDTGSRLVAAVAGNHVLVLEGRSSSHHRAHVSANGGASWTTSLLSEHVSGRVGSALAGAMSAGGEAIAAFHRARMEEKEPGVAGVRFESTHLLLRRLGDPAAGGEECPDSPTSAERVRSLVNRLGSASWQEREAAERDLVAIGPAARAAVEEASGSADPEVRERASRVLPLLGEPWWTEED